MQLDYLSSHFVQHFDSVEKEGALRIAKIPNDFTLMLFYHLSTIWHVGSDKCTGKSTRFDNPQTVSSRIKMS